MINQSVKYYHVTEAGLVEGEALGRISVVLKADYEEALDKLTGDLNHQKNLTIEVQDYTEELESALQKIGMWPDGGNCYGQEKIKTFAVRIMSGTKLVKAITEGYQK